MDKGSFQGYILSTDLCCSEKAIDLLCHNLDLSKKMSNIHYSHRDTKECDICHGANFELFSYHYEEWNKLFNQPIADELKEKFSIQTVCVGICYNCKNWKISFYRNKEKYDYENVLRIKQDIS